MLEEIDAYLNLGFIGIVILILRLLVIPLSVYNLLWSFQGFWYTVRGKVFPWEVYRSVIFYFSSATMALQVMAYSGMSMLSYSPIASLIFQCFLLMGCIMATVGRQLTKKGNFENFYWLLKGNNLDVAVRSANLNMIDPEYTERRLSRAEEDLPSGLTKVD